MLTYCLKCGKNTESKDPKTVKIKNGRIKLTTKCAVCKSKKPRFIQEASRLLSKLAGIKVPILSDLPIINTLF